MWSGGGFKPWEGMRLRHAVRTRLRAVLEPDCPALEPSVRDVLEQRLDSAVRDLMDLFQRSLDPGLSVKQEQSHIKEEQEAVGGASVSDFMVVCVKSEEEEQEIQARPETPSTTTATPQDQDLDQDLDQDPDFHPEQPQDGTRTRTFLYCPQCGSTLRTQNLQRPPAPPPLGAQAQCSFCAQSFGRDALLLEHNYGRDLQSHGGVLDRAGTGFSCSLCAQDFSQVGALLDHMSQHLSAPGRQQSGRGLRLNSEDSDWSFEDDMCEGEAFEDDMNCSVCGSLFRDSEQLQEHMRKHLR